MNKPYAFRAEHVRRLRSLKSELESWEKAFIDAWNNHEYSRAKVAQAQANLAYANLQAYQNTLVGWSEKGIPTDGWAI